MIVVPSQVSEFIDKEFAGIPRDNTKDQFLKLTADICGSLRALILMVEAIPNGTTPYGFGYPRCAPCEH